MKVNALDYSHLSEPEMMFGRRGSPDNFFFFFFVVVLHSIVKINKNNQRYIHHAQKKHEWENVRRRSTIERRKCAKAKRKKRRRNFLDLPWTGTTTTPTETAGFGGLITMRGWWIKWFLLLIGRYIRRCWLLPTWSTTVKNGWIFLIRLACAHNLSKRKTSSCHFSLFTFRFISFLSLEGNKFLALFQVDRQELR